MQSEFPNDNTGVRKRPDELLPGDVLLTPLYRSDGLMLADRYKKLNDALIAIIRKQISSTSTISVSPVSQSSPDVVTYIPLYRSSLENPIIEALQSTPYWTEFDSNYESEALKRRAISIKNEFIRLLRNNELFVSFFIKIKEYSMSLLIFSLNTTCLALKIGITLEMTTEDLLDLATAALFSNIGYTELPRIDFKSVFHAQQYNHPAMQKHIEIFSKITSSSPYLRKKNIILGILDHHEYYNGEGYPNRKRGTDITLFGRVIHVANDYDRLVGSYDNRPSLAPYEAFQIIFENKDLKYDPHILDIFLRRTTYFKLGEVITLADGGTGRIIDFEDYLLHPCRPIVKTNDGYVLNLLTSMLQK